MPTLQTCLACGGNYEIVEEDDTGRYRGTMCRWCTSGGMTLKQARKWHRHVQGRKSSGKIPIPTIPAPPPVPSDFPDEDRPTPLAPAPKPGKDPEEPL